MKQILAFLFVLYVVEGFSQTCTALTSGNWSGGGPPTATWSCGNPNTFSGTIIIPAGITVTITNNLTWNANVEVYGTLILDNQLNLGSTPGCGFTLRIFGSGILIRPTGPGANDRLIICGNTIVTSQPGPPPGTIAWPPGGFDSTTPGGGFGEGGFLPVELIYFKSESSGVSIVLLWATSKEENFSHFVVEHAVNGVDFDEITEIPGAGYNTEDIIEYSYTHKVPKLGFNYYRLKAVDLDGTFEYFGPIGERFRGEQALWVFPNPAASDKVQYEINFTPNESDRVQVYNQLGTLIADLPAVVHTGTVYFQEALKPGAYVLRYSGSGEVLSARFIVLK